MAIIREHHHLVMAMVASPLSKTNRDRQQCAYAAIPFYSNVPDTFHVHSICAHMRICANIVPAIQARDRPMPCNNVRNANAICIGHMRWVDQL